MRSCAVVVAAAISLILCATLFSAPTGSVRPSGWASRQSASASAFAPTAAAAAAQHDIPVDGFQTRSSLPMADNGDDDSLPAPAAHVLDGSLSAALHIATGGQASGVVLLTFGNSGVLPTLKNFVLHASSVGAPFVVGAVDAPAFDQLTATYGTEVAVYKTPLALDDDYRLDGSNAHASSSWQRFAAMRTKEVARIVNLGYDVLHTDVDVVWLRNPAPYITCEAGGDAHDPKDARCDQLKAADVAVSSDNMSPGEDLRGGVGYAIGGTLNTGILLVRATDAGKRFATLWHETVAERACPATTAATCPKLCTHGSCYAGTCAGDCNGGRCCTSDQQVLNRMVRDEALPYPGLRVPHGAARTTRASAKSNVTLGALPLALFLHGHGYFVQRSRLVKAAVGAAAETSPYAVHATYTLDDHDGLAKAQRFREGGLWRVDPPSFHAGRYLAFNASLPTTGDHERIAKGEVPTSIAAHISALPHYMVELRDALALARALNRTLVLPKWACFCDRLWSGSDDIFHFGCMYPGAQDGKFVPFVCPMDHVLSPKRWNEAGVPYRDTAFLQHPSMRDGDIVDVLVGAASTPRGLMRGMSDTEAAKQLSPHSDARVLRLSSASGLLCGLDDNVDEFNRLAARLLTPPAWCSTCFQPCKRELKRWLDDETIAKGADGASRWCARFQPPPPLPASSRGCHA